MATAIAAQTNENRAMSSLLYLYNENNNVFRSEYETRRSDRVEEKGRGDISQPIRAGVLNL